MTMSVNKAFLLAALIKFADSCDESASEEVISFLKENHEGALIEGMEVVTADFLRLLVAGPDAEKEPSSLVNAVEALLQSNI